MAERQITDVPVTPEQYGQLQVAWFLCSFPGSRRITGDDSARWNESVQHILGYIPEGDWSPVQMGHAQGTKQEST